MVGKLKLSSPTIMIDELNGWVVGKCASLTICAATLQFVIDAVNGDASPTREEYDKRIRRVIEKGEVIPEITWWNNEPSKTNFYNIPNVTYQTLNVNPSTNHYFNSTTYYLPKKEF